MARSIWDYFELAKPYRLTLKEDRGALKIMLNDNSNGRRIEKVITREIMDFAKCGDPALIQTIIGELKEKMEAR